MLCFRCFNGSERHRKKEKHSHSFECSFKNRSGDLESFLYRFGDRVDRDLKLSEKFSSWSATTGARKLLDVCRSFPEGKKIVFSKVENRLLITCEKSRYILATLPVEEFPEFNDSKPVSEFVVQEEDLLKILHKRIFP